MNANTLPSEPNDPSFTNRPDIEDLYGRKNDASDYGGYTLKVTLDDLTPTEVDDGDVQLDLFSFSESVPCEEVSDGDGTPEIDNEGYELPLALQGLVKHDDLPTATSRTKKTVSCGDCPGSSCTHVVEARRFTKKY